VTPLVTIGLLCYNARDTVERAIKGALAQKWPNLEVIVVDDASSDGTPKVAESAVARDPRARLVRQKKNLGPSGTRNTVLHEAKGEFVVFMDDDDESLPDRVTEQVRTLTEYEARTGETLVACYAAGRRHYPNGYVMEMQAIGATGEAPHGPDVANWLMFHRRAHGWEFGSGVPACALMARRSTFTAVGGFDRNLRRVEDGEFAIRLALKGGHFIGTQKPLFIQYSTQGADKTPEKNLEAHQYIATKHADYLRSITRFDYAWRWPRLRYWHFKRRYAMLALDLLILLARHPLSTANHLLDTGAQRLLHERKMRR
jgi:glycosyltransferase involved in cell wall biosynthesis